MVQAENDLAIMGETAAALDNNDVVRVHQQIRGGKTVRLLKEDPLGLKLERALLLFRGVQEYLNKSLAADAVVSEYMTALRFVPEAGVNMSDEIVELRAKCMSRNYAILDGSTAVGCLESYSRFFDYSSEAWGDWRLDIQDKYESCIEVICVMQDLYHRLIFKFNQPHIWLVRCGHNY